MLYAIGFPSETSLVFGLRVPLRLGLVALFGGSVPRWEPGVQARREPLVFPAVTRRCCCGSSEEKKVQDEGAQPHGWSLEACRTFAKRLPAMQFGEGSSHRLQDLRLVQEPRRNRSLIIAFVRSEILEV